MTEELKQKAEDFYFKKYTRTLNVGEEERQKAITEAYITGATENGIQWHDLRKDSNDLPKKNKSYWVYIDCQGNKIYRSIVWQGHWLGWNCVPLAWCEEPQFE